MPDWKSMNGKICLPSQMCSIYNAMWIVFEQRWKKKVEQMEKLRIDNNSKRMAKVILVLGYMTYFMCT